MRRLTARASPRLAVNVEQLDAYATGGDFPHPELDRLVDRRAADRVPDRESSCFRSIRAARHARRSRLRSPVEVDVAGNAYTSVWSSDITSTVVL